MAVLISGSAISGIFSFEALADVLSDRMGAGGRYLLGFGLFAAGFTSAVTAPLAAAVTILSLFGQKSPEKWGSSSWRYRITWIIVLCTGLAFASMNIKPVPAIILAQALNGFLLPFVSIFLYIVIQRSLYEKSLAKSISNLLMLIVIYISLIIGLNSAIKAVARLMVPEFINTLSTQIIIAAFSLVVIILVAVRGSKGLNNSNS